MEQTGKLKAWIKEQVPMLTLLYENKYVGMLYDRFASLPPAQQKKWITVFLFGVSGAITLYLAVSYYGLWSLSRRNTSASAMGALLQQYQQIKRDKSQEISSLESNSALAAPGQLKQRLLDMGRATGISPRMMEANEKSEASARTEDAKASSELKVKRASITLQKVTLTQIVNFLKNVESGQYSLNVSKLKVETDPQLKGYMLAQFDVTAYLFSPEEP